ncbi:MAG: mechanosensitive ion channel family protein [Chthonomonadales bacterium]
MGQIATTDFWVHLARRIVEVVLTRGLSVVLLIAGYFAVRGAVNRVIDVAIRRLDARVGAVAISEERLARIRTLQALVKSITGYVLLFVLLIMLLDALGANVSGLVATAGIGGVALGFGAQRLVRDVISGIFLIVEDQFGVGDYVTIGQATGVVEELGMRTTRIRDEQGRLWILANGDILSVTNYSRSPIETFVDVGIAPVADVAAAKEVLNRACRELYDATRIPGLAAAPSVVGISAWDAGRITLRIVIPVDPKQATAAQTAVRNEAFEALKEAAIPMA